MPGPPAALLPKRLQAEAKPAHAQLTLVLTLGGGFAPRSSAAEAVDSTAGPKEPLTRTC
jgi:hypothetical protein